DQGVDLIIGKNNETYAVQIKRYTEPVNNSAVQEIASGRMFYNCNYAIVLTNSTFTTSAIELANKINVLLWDGEKLLSLLEEYLTARGNVPTI
ncbi:MAG: restriction endonuclease, partial [Alicyclobacillus herbarius]|uniref:restriction endonuclease n=1 Tax=Alicyclobacillus herbarius TaxID=122960 RepID=UPI0023559F22